MVGFGLLTVGLIDIAGHATLTKEQHWLLSVFLGIVMCKIVYDLTGVVSSVFFSGYAKLDKKGKLEWNNRGFSTFHAIVVAAASLHLLIASDLFDAASQDELIVNRKSPLSDTILGVLHHGLSVFSIIQSLLSGQGLIYILMVLFTEITTPFVNLRWYLDTAGQKDSKLYVCNGLALFLGWLVARILLFMYFFVHLFSHFDQVKEVYTLGFYSLLTVPPVLAMMNAFWFLKIARGEYHQFIKTVAGSEVLCFRHKWILLEFHVASL
ncbi:uncharacterized protein [Coffea arabica]|uniref:Uncharacterized protein isoform X3 n=1 Tax=Coffea arabica TaxID=13443 RepID=A0ABM4VE29_COFAR